jgi:uncharacterized protein
MADASAERAVALVEHSRISADRVDAYSAWLVRVAERLNAWPGFVGQEVVPPAPPAQVDWTVVQRFASVEAAHRWLDSQDRARLIDEVGGCFVGPQDLHLLPDAGPRPTVTASAMISFNVAPEDEAAFLKWQGRVQAAEARFPGFRRHKLERPMPGVHDDWLVVLNFDNEGSLNGWLDSDERRALLAEGGRFGSGLNIRRSNYGFDFWFPAETKSPADRHGIFKSNLLILVVLYPLVFCWSHFVGSRLIDQQGMPFWIVLFVGNLITTQLLGWWFAPVIVGLFRWWLPPGISLRRQLAGYAATVGLYVLALGAAALLTAWQI